MDTADDPTQGHNQTRCRRCGGFVTARFARVFGDNDDQVYGCHQCTSTRELFSASSATGSSD
jgi:hypothetical protein